MMLVECLEQKKMSMYRLAQSSGIPYATVHDICSGKTFTAWRGLWARQWKNCFRHAL